MKLKVAVTDEHIRESLQRLNQGYSILFHSPAAQAIKSLLDKPYEVSVTPTKLYILPRIDGAMIINTVPEEAQPFIVNSLQLFVAGQFTLDIDSGIKAYLNQSGWEALS